MTRIGDRARSAGADTVADDGTTETENQILVRPLARTRSCAQLCGIYYTHERALTLRGSTPIPALRLQRAELTNALDKLRATRQALEREKSVNAALTAKLTAAADTYRAVGQTFNAVRRGVDEVSSTLSRVEARQGRGHGGGDTAGDGDGDGDPAVATLARLVAECVHRDAFARRRAEALLSRAKRLAAKPRRAARSGSRSASALARDLRVRLAHRESHIVRLTERLAHQSQRRASAAAGGSFAAAAAALFRPANGPARADDVSADDVSGATASAVAQLAAHRADVLAARAREAGVTWLRDARDTEARAAAAARAEKQTAAPSGDFLFRSAEARFADDADLARVAAERDAALALAERASVGARARVDATARLLDARNREYVSATRERQARREAVEERKRLLARGASEVDAKSADASYPKRGAPRLAARRDGAENARPADARQDAKRQRRAPREMDPFAAHFNSSCES